MVSYHLLYFFVCFRRNPQIRMNFFGVLSFNAPYLPWVLLLFSLLLGNNILVDFMGKLQVEDHGESALVTMWFKLSPVRRKVGVRAQIIRKVFVFIVVFSVSLELAWSVFSLPSFERTQHSTDWKKYKILIKGSLLFFKEKNSLFLCFEWLAVNCSNQKLNNIHIEKKQAFFSKFPFLCPDCYAERSQFDEALRVIQLHVKYSRMKWIKMRFE